MAITKLGQQTKITKRAKVLWVMPVYSPIAYKPKQDIKRTTYAGAIAGAAASLITKNVLKLPIRTKAARILPYVVLGASLGNVYARYHNKQIMAARNKPKSLKILKPGQF